MATVVTPPAALDRRVSSWPTDEAAIDRWTNEGGAHSRREIERAVAELTKVSSSRSAGRIMQKLDRGSTPSTLPIS
jgi:hypothetical protein